MNSKFDILEKLGQGAYGTVFKVQPSQSLLPIAIKVVKQSENDDGIPCTSLREIAILKGLNHPNVIKLLESNFVHSKGLTEIHLHFPFINEDLGKYKKRVKIIPKITCKKIFYQILKGMLYLHQKRIFHRDLKPQNILIDENQNVKISDFGLSRVTSFPIKSLSKQIQTLWYRAPELILGIQYYGISVDVWSLGCILYELEEGMILFKGDSEIGQLFMIFEILGTPKISQYPELLEMPFFKKKYPKMQESLKNYVFSMDEHALSLMKQMLKINPSERISIKDALKHPYFNEVMQ